jgi:catechol 2,3-dioxygenase-like lactoylglutathione lyase family enzyme
MTTEGDMTQRFDHVDLRVNEYGAAKRFYDRLCPAMGFTEPRGDEEWFGYAAPGDRARQPFLGFFVDPGHRPNANRIAFWAESSDDVNRLAGVASGAGARQVEGPGWCEEYGPDYYAVFFEDPAGNRWEICCRARATG